jgi:hypothetical protein
MRCEVRGQLHGKRRGSSLRCLRRKILSGTEESNRRVLILGGTVMHMLAEEAVPERLHRLTIGGTVTRGRCEARGFQSIVACQYFKHRLPVGIGGASGCRVLRIRLRPARWAKKL